MMRAGELKKKVTIKQPVRVQNELGESIETMQDFATVRAKVESLRVREYFEAKQVQSKATHRFKMRYLSGVSTEMKIEYDGKTFNIESITDPEERHRELQLLAYEETYE